MAVHAAFAASNAALAAAMRPDDRKQGTSLEAVNAAFMAANAQLGAASAALAAVSAAFTAAKDVSESSLELRPILVSKER